MRQIKILKGKFKGELFADLAIFKRNFAALEALDRGYTIENEPFYYGKIGILGFILSKGDLGLWIMVWLVKRLKN